MATANGKPRPYSRRGDLGETSLVIGPRVGKDHCRIELVGAVEELSAWLGKARLSDVDPEVAALLLRLQERLLVVSVEAASLDPSLSDNAVVTENHIGILERAADSWNARVPLTRGTVLPGGTRAAADLWVAYSVCRRAERRATALLRFDARFSPRALAWLNRLSALIAILARYENTRVDGAETVVALKDACARFDDELV